jgi:hypothetical protein
LNNENTIDHQLIPEPEESIGQKPALSDKAFEKINEEAGVVLSGMSLKRFEDIRSSYWPSSSSRSHCVIY